MKNVGLIGEDPNDTSSIKNLLNQKYSGHFKFHVLCKRIKGYQLDNPKVKASLPIEFEDAKCKFVIYIRDLDGFSSEQKKIADREAWFNGLDTIFNNSGLLLLNIWELEALILSDIETFNKLYKTDNTFKKNPSSIKDPKEYLMDITKKGQKQYKVSHCPEIFKKLSFDEVKKNCSYFNAFVTKLDAKK